MSEETNTPYKRIWNDTSTKLLITVFKDYYELWKNGTIGKKNQMWQKITKDLNKKGLDCTAGQAENRFKTLIRSYRKACGIIPGRNGRKFHHPFTEDFTNILIENIGLLQDEEETIIIDASNQDDGVQQFLDESTGFTLTPQIELSQNKEIINIDEIFTTKNRRFSGNLGAKIDKIINNNEQILSKTSSSSRNKRTKLRRKPVSVTSKTNVDVLLEMKELLKKIEIRRQTRHEQNIKIAKERNAILRRNNELLERLLAKQN